MLKRYLQDPVIGDLAEKMVLVAGPRQVGKTTMAKQILEESKAGVYLTWDRSADRKELREAVWPGGEALVVLDELHKYRHWKRWLKGEFDKHRERLRFLVTGSARMDVYRRGGDSLQGRYHHYRLHPFSLAEMSRTAQRSLPEPGTPLEFPRTDQADNLHVLMQFGGFPEPLLAQSDRKLRRWQKDRVDRFFREDLRDLESIRDLSSMQLLADLLTERVASLLSINSLREDLEVSHKAVARWMDILERLYFIFRIPPFDSRQIRGLKKMPKAYLWDPSLVSDPGARFENLVALHLLKFCHFLEDSQGFRMELSFLREAGGREVDFLVSCRGKPWFAVEVKLSEEWIANKSLEYFQSRLKIPFAYQIALQATRDRVHQGIRHLPAAKFLKALV